MNIVQPDTSIHALHFSCFAFRGGGGDSKKKKKKMTVMIVVPLGVGGGGGICGLVPFGVLKSKITTVGVMAVANKN